MRQSGLADGPQWLIDAWGGQKTLAGERVSLDNALSIAAVFSAVRLICDQVSVLPMRVYRDLSMSPTNTGNGIVEANDHRTYPILAWRPNPITTGKRFWSTVAAHQLLWGNWYIEKFRDEFGLVEELRLLNPSRVEVEYSELTGSKRFFVNRGMQRDGPFGPDRILHGYGFSRDGIIGLSPIEQCREALGTAKARTRYESDVYAKPVVSGVVQHPGKLNTPVKLSESWRAVYGPGGKDRHGIAVLEEGATFQPISAPLADMQFVESAQLSLTEIAVMFGLTPGDLGGSTGDSLTYATVESNRIQLATRAVAPVVTNIAEFVSQDVSIFPFPSWFCAFVIEAMMRGEPGARADYWAKMKTTLNLDPKYIAQVENIPESALLKPEPVPDTLKPFVGGNGATTDETGMIAANGTAGAGAGAD